MRKKSWNFGIFLHFFQIFAHFDQFLTSQRIIMAKNQFSVPNLHGKSVLSLNIIHKIGQLGHPNLKFWNIFFYFYNFFAHFGLFSDPQTIYNGQKSIKRPKIHTKRVLLLNKIHKIGETGSKNVKKWSKTTYSLY